MNETEVVGNAMSGVTWDGEFIPFADVAEIFAMLAGINVEALAGLAIVVSRDRFVEARRVRTGPAAEWPMCLVDL